MWIKCIQTNKTIPKQKQKKTKKKTKNTRWKPKPQVVVAISIFLGFPSGSAGKESACNAGDLGSILGLGISTGEGKGDPLEKGRATLSSILAWRIPWSIQSMGSQRVRQDCVIFTFIVKYLRESIAFI